MSNKIGVGVVTCNRQEFFQDCINSIPKNEVDTLIVVNDGSQYQGANIPSHVSEYIQNKQNLGVGESKNIIMRKLIQDGCDHIFLVEDDMSIVNPAVFEHYIKTAFDSGMYHLNYGPGSPFNRKQKPGAEQGDLEKRQLLDMESAVNPRVVINYGSTQVPLYRHIAGSFSYFHRNVIKHIGYHDENFFNAWEHVEYAYRVIQAGLLPAFWWFPDAADSELFLKEAKDSIAKSSIAGDKEKWQKNLVNGAAWYKHKHGHFPAQVADTPIEAVKEKLKFIKTNYSRPYDEKK